MSWSQQQKAEKNKGWRLLEVITSVFIYFLDMFLSSVKTLLQLRGTGLRSEWGMDCTVISTRGGGVTVRGGGVKEGAVHGTCMHRAPHRQQLGSHAAPGPARNNIYTVFSQFIFKKCLVPEFCQRHDPRFNLDWFFHFNYTLLYIVTLYHSFFMFFTCDRVGSSESGRLRSRAL